MDDSEIEVLICQAGDLRCALPLGHVVEICRPLPVQPVIDAPRAVLGMGVLRGNATPLLDLGELVAATPLSRPARWVSVRVGVRTVALAVDRVSGIRRLLRRDVQALPPLLAGARAAREALALLDRELVVVLDAARLLSGEAWRQLDRAHT